MNEDNPELITCIGCGCDDFNACEDAFGDPCSWLRTNQARGLGVCSECPEHVDRFDGGDLSKWNEPHVEPEGLLLPGDDEYHATLAAMRARKPQ
jgi:hypothetical protein